MKTNKIIKGIGGLFIMSMLIVACSNEMENNIPDPQGDTSIEIETKALPGGLEGDLYIFCKKGTTGDYTLTRKVEYGTDEKKNVDFRNDSLTADFNYRLFFVATTPTAKPEINVGSTTNSTILKKGDEWKNIRLAATKEDLSDQFYYGSIDKTGPSFLLGNKITMDVSRLVGQQLLEIAKVENEDLKSPIDVSSKAFSVLDRVYRIELEYEGLTKVVAFNDNAKIIEKEKWPTPYKQTIKPVISEANDTNFLKVEVPQDKRGLVKTKEGKKGSVRIMGAFGLPATETVRIKASFSYYHTVPVCGNSHADHYDTNCFEEKKLELNLPPKLSTPPLSIKSNTFTVNKAGLNYDRIIDIKVDGGLTFDTSWN